MGNSHVTAKNARDLDGSFRNSQENSFEYLPPRFLPPVALAFGFEIEIELELEPHCSAEEVLDIGIVEAVTSGYSRIIGYYRCI
jgi:hypothetical protein